MGSRLERIEETDEGLARRALRAILVDPGAPAAAKASAARTLAEIAGVIGRNAKPTDDEDLADAFSMSVAEINAELRGLNGRKP